MGKDYSGDEIYDTRATFPGFALFFDIGWKAKTRTSSSHVSDPGKSQLHRSQSVGDRIKEKKIRVR